MCGIIGIIGTNRASFETYKGLYTLQHRGQDAAGILSYNQSLGKFRLVKDSGLVSEVFDEKSIESLNGDMAIGHTRYSTVGKGEREDIQPHILNYPLGIGMAHNGNLVNYHDLVQKLKTKFKRHSLTNNDLEVMLNLFANYLSDFSDIHYGELKQAATSMIEDIVGGYALVGIIADKGLYGLRDPNGIRPLVLGRKKNTDGSWAHILCSESNTLYYLGYEIIKNVEPGEFIFIDNEGIIHSDKLTKVSKKSCMFEWVYFSSAESIIDHKGVYEARIQLGEVLAKRVQAEIEKGEIAPHVVAPVPETSRLAAIAVGEKLGVRYREILIKNRYIQRSFILNSDEKREDAVTLKLSPVKHEVEGKNILLVDDSIVRGTTSKKIVKSLREAGAKKIYVATTCPPIKNPCYFGVDFPDTKKLVANDRDFQEIEKELGIDKVIYITIEDLQEALDSNELCMACLDGNYPVNVEAANEFVKNRLIDRYNPTNP